MRDDDLNMASLARRLAEALCVYARERRADHKIEIQAVHTELCAAWRAEQLAALAAAERVAAALEEE